MNPTLREQLKAVIREVLTEEFQGKSRSGYDRDEEQPEDEDDRTNQRGRVRDPEHDRRLKENRSA